MKRISVYAAALLIAFTLLAIPRTSLAQCGDFDNNGLNEVSDIVDLYQYLLDGGAAPVDYDQSDFDLHQKLTFNDLAHLYACAPICDFFDVQCPPTLAAASPSVDPNFKIQVPSRVPIGATNLEIPLIAHSPIKSQAICLPLRIRIDGLVPLIDSIVTPSLSTYSDASGNAPIRNHKVLDSDSGLVVVSGAKLWSLASPLVDDHIASIFVTVAPQAYKQTIDIQFIDYTPAQAAVGQEDAIFPMYLPANFLNSADPPMEPVLEPDCCLVGGDADGDGHASIGDAVMLICIIFSGCSLEGVCPETLDADGSGALSIGDAVYLINYIFGGGPAPECGPLGGKNE